MDERNSNLLQAQLTQHYQFWLAQNERSFKVQNWCITVWLATLALPHSVHLDLATSQRLALSLLPVFLFWMVSGVQSAFADLVAQRPKSLEKALLQNDSKFENGDRYFLVSGTDEVTFRQKLRALVTSLFLAESVTVFYLIIAIATLAFHYLLHA